MDKNVITWIETGRRYITDIELLALKEIFGGSYDYLIEGTESLFWRKMRYLIGFLMKKCCRIVFQGVNDENVKDKIKIMSLHKGKRMLIWF